MGSAIFFPEDCPRDEEGSNKMELGGCPFLKIR